VYDRIGKDVVDGLASKALRDTQGITVQLLRPPKKVT